MDLYGLNASIKTVPTRDGSKIVLYYSDLYRYLIFLESEDDPDPYSTDEEKAKRKKKKSKKKRRRKNSSEDSALERVPKTKEEEDKENKELRKSLPSKLDIEPLTEEELKERYKYKKHKCKLSHIPMSKAITGQVCTFALK